MNVLFFDIDGTLMNDENYIPKSAIKAIRNLRDKGDVVIISTGRPLCTIPLDVLDIGFDGVVAACGASVHLYGKTILENYVPSSLLHKLISLFNKHGIKMILEGPKHLYLQNIYDPAYENEIKRYSVNKGDVFCNWSLDITDVNKLTYNTRFVGDLSPVKQILKNNFVKIKYNDDDLDWIIKGHTKATGIQLIKGAIGKGIDKTFAFGDSENDIEMFSVVDYSIAMAGSPERVVSASKYVTQSLENDGIVNALIHFGLL